MLPGEGAGGGAGVMQMLITLPMMLGMGAMSFLYIGRSNGTMTWLFGGLFAASAVGMLLVGLSRTGAQRKNQLNDERRDYLRYLNSLRDRVRRVARGQREELRAAMPDPADLWSVAGTQRMWQRRITDPDFGRVRVATAPQLLATPLRAPETAPVEDLDPVATTALRQFIRTHATVPGLPVAVSLRAFSRVTVSGPRADVLDLARAMLAHLVTFHHPETLRIACCAALKRAPDWEWLKWLPHSTDPGRADAAGPVRWYAESPAKLAVLLSNELSARGPYSKQPGLEQSVPHIVIVLDEAAPSFVDDWQGVTVIDVSGGRRAQATAGLELVVDGARLGMRTDSGIMPIGNTDRMDRAQAEVVARQLTSLNPAAVGDDAPVTGLGLAELLGIGDPRAVDPAITWQPRSSRDRLRIPIGVDQSGRPVDLDLKESAEGGMGPHGLVIGATGSGKSELLRTLVTALAVTHSSEILNMALIDFKGGATFAGMTTLPHTCAVITNLADDLTLVDRMGDALRGEMVRRQELLRAAGNYSGVRDYERARMAGAALSPLPSLLVIIDEFSELLSSQPDFIDLFVMIGRLGRSLGIHLLLASQNLDEGRLRGLDTHLSYRIALRTFSSSASRAVLGVPDAYELPPVPGSAYLRADTTSLMRFNSAYVSGALPRQPREGHTAPIVFRHRPAAFTLAAAPLPEVERPQPTGESREEAVPHSETVMGAMLDALTGKGPAAHQIWLPPLGDPSTLDQMLPGLRETPERGFTLEGWEGIGRLTVPIAIVDKPFEQRRDLMWADLSGAAGHAVVAGAPQSGKSTLLRTLVCALALTHTPVEVQFFLLDFGGGGLSTLAGLPHVSGCAQRLDVERVRRTIAELTALLAERERLFAERGIDSMAAFRREPPRTGDRDFGDVFLVVDGWGTLRTEYEELEDEINNLAGRGLGYGIHVVVSVNRWMELRSALRDLIATQFELRLGDPTDSAIDRRVAANVPAGAPGRGLSPEKLQFLTALSRVDGRPSVNDLSAGVADLVKRVDSAWHGPRAPRLRLLPRLLKLGELPPPVPGDRHVPIGLAESDLQPVHLDFGSDPHMIAYGDTECGKTALLRLLAKQITDRYTPKQAVVMVVDYRRGLIGAVGGEHLLEYCGAEGQVTEAVAQIEQVMTERLPGADVTPEQLRNRDWWKGPEVFILIDDYDLVATQNNPIAPLVPFLAQAKDIGLHLVIVRRSGGASRAMYDQVLQRLRDLATPGLVMSGDKDEGALVGNVKPSAHPPGRGVLVTRRSGAALVQLAYCET